MSSSIVISENYTAVAGNSIAADTSGAAFTISLPATASIGDLVAVSDAKLSWNVNNLTLARNGLNLNGGTSDYVASIVGDQLTAVYISTSYGWSVK